MEEKKIDNKPKIFSIRKIKRRKKKDFFNRKIIIKVNNGLKKKEIILQNSFNPNSLISISHEVKKFIKAKKTTTSNEVTNHIVSLLNSTNNISMSFKNIQRRVYDAINVMASIGLAHKENNVITYLNVNKITKEKAKEQISTLKSEIKNKQINLISKLSEINCYNSLISQNKSSFSRSLTLDRLHLPFILVKEDKDKRLKINQSLNKERLIAFSYKKIEVTTFDEIAKKVSFPNKQEIPEMANSICGEKCKEYIIKENLVNKFYSDLIRESEIIKKKEKEKAKLKDKKKLFDVDFSCLFNNNSNMGQKENLDESYIEQIDENRDYTMNASTNFYSKLSLI